MNLNTVQSIAQDLLASVQGQEGVDEVIGRGHLAGIGHNGVVVNNSENPGESDRRVILEVSQEPVITPAVARGIYGRLSVIADQDKDYRTFTCSLRLAMSPWAREKLSRAAML